MTRTTTMDPSRRFSCGLANSSSMAVVVIKGQLTQPKMINGFLVTCHFNYHLHLVSSCHPYYDSPSPPVIIFAVLCQPIISCPCMYLIESWCSCGYILLSTNYLLSMHLLESFLPPLFRHLYVLMCSRRFLIIVWHNDVQYQPYQIKSWFVTGDCYHDSCSCYE